MQLSYGNKTGEAYVMSTTVRKYSVMCIFGPFNNTETYGKSVGLEHHL